MAAAAPGAYDGLRVVDFSHVIAGPLCTKLLADHGAEVIKIESLAGDMMRRFPYPIEAPGTTTQFIQYNLGKRSIAMDLRDDEVRELVFELCDKADVVVENFRPGTMARLGLEIDELRRRNPRLIFCSVSTFGAVGPASEISGFGFVAEARSGLMYLNGDAGDKPSAFGTALADMNASLHAFAAIGAALYRRSVSGEGTFIDISSYDALVTMIDHALALHNLTGGERVFGRYGTRHPLIIPNGVTQTADGEYVAYGCAADAQFHALVGLMGKTEWQTDPKYSTGAARVAVQKEVYDAVDDWAATIATADELVAILADAGTTGARIQEYTEAATDEHLIARGTLAPVDVRGVGETLLPSAPHPMSGLSVAPAGDAPGLGEHTRAVLTGELGLSDERIDELLARGVVAEPAAGAIA
jgi:crotonobetainyl-CoA:carnitine CoA-transferase CaiB-like acyl-CoA transferase